MAHLSHRFITYFPVPTFLKMPSVGIDISASAVRCLEIYDDNGCMKIGKYDSYELKQQIEFSEDITQNEELKIVLTNWKKKYRLTFVEVSLPEEKAYLFQTDVPEGGEREMRDSIEFSLEENAPLSPSEAVFDFKVIGPSQKPGYQSAMVTVIPEKIVSGHTALLNSCGLTPVSFLMEAQALSKAIVPKNNKETYFVIHVAKNKTVLFIIVNGVVRFSSSVIVGSDSFTNALVTAFGVERKEAEDLKWSQGFLQSKDNKTREVLAAALSPLKEEMERIWIYWHTRKGERTEDIQQVLLSGRDTHLPGFKEYVSQSFRVPLEEANVWSNMCSFDDYVPSIPKNEAGHYGIAIGLALPKLS